MVNKKFYLPVFETWSRSLVMLSLVYLATAETSVKKIETHDNDTARQREFRGADHILETKLILTQTTP